MGASVQQVEKLPSRKHSQPNDAPISTVLLKVSGALDEMGTEYGLIGGIASSVLGRPRATSDIDVFVAPRDAKPVLAGLSERGFETDRLDDQWIYKAKFEDVVVDLIFSTRYGIYFDDEMKKHARSATFLGAPVRVVSPEDLLIIKAVAHDEATPRHWHDALGLLTRSEFDWAYLLNRSRCANRRVLSLLLYAQSLDIWIPDHVIRALVQRVCAS